MNEDHIDRVMAMIPWPVVFVDKANVNNSDLLESWRPGAIIRCDGTPHIMVRFVDGADLSAMGCVAGWISEEA